MLLAVKSNNSVVNSQQDFYVVVALPGVSTAAPDSVIDLPRQRVEGPRDIQLWLCIGEEETEAKEVSEKHEVMNAATFTFSVSSQLYSAVVKMHFFKLFSPLDIVDDYNHPHKFILLSNQVKHERFISPLCM